jgi:hypothetical protein
MCERVKVFRGQGRSTALPILAVAAHRGGWKKNLFVTVQSMTIAFRCSQTRYVNLAMHPLCLVFALISRNLVQCEDVSKFKTRPP